MEFTKSQLIGITRKLIDRKRETEWVEFKENNANPKKLGEYISALSNSSCAHDEPFEKHRHR